MKADISPKQWNDLKIIIGPCELRASENILCHKQERVRLEPRVVQVLYLLSQYTNKLVTREQLIDTVWLGRPVTDDAITRCISRLRKAFGDELNTPIKIETVAKSGYRLLVEEENSKNGSKGMRSGPAVLLLSFTAVIGVIAAFVLMTPTPSDDTVYRREALVISEQWQRYPEFSPDGALLTYSEGNRSSGMSIMVRQFDGSGMQRLTRQQYYDHQPAFSPDGKNIAFARTSAEGCEIRLVPAIGAPSIGGTQTLIGRCGKEGVYDLAWTPDGKYLLMITKDEPSHAASLISISLGDGSQKDITPSAFDGVDDLAVSPQGKIAVSVHYALGVEDIFIGDLNSLSESDNADQWRRITMDQVKIHGLAWRDTSDSLLFTSNRTGSFQLWEFNVNDNNLRVIPEGLTGASAIASHPGGDIVLERWREESEVMRVDMRDKSEVNIIAAKGVNWDASINSAQQMIYVSDRTDSAELWLREEQQDRRISDYRGPWVIAPRWSPNGKKIAFMVPLEHAFSVHIFDINRNQLAANFSEHDAFAPQWSKDGSGLYFGSKRSGEWQIWYRRIDHKEAKQITTRGGKTAQLSQDAKHLFVTKSNLPGLWRIALDMPDKEELLVTDLVPVDWNNWQVVEDDIFYVQRPSPGTGTAVLRKYTPKDKTTAIVHELTDFLYFSGIHVDKKSNTFTYAKMTSSDADIDLLRSVNRP